MKESAYNIYIASGKANDKVLIINGVSGNFAVVSVHVSEALKKISENPSHLSSLSEEEVRFLCNYGFMIDGNMDEEALFKHHAKLAHTQNLKYFGLNFIPSYACNFRCPYCFEREMYKNSPDFFAKQLSKESVIASFSGADKLIKEGRELFGVTLFGGEPLLPGNRKIIELICELTKKHGVKLSCVTNGYYLDEYIGLFKQYEIGALKLTLDGPKEIHDSRRGVFGGGGSFDRITANVDTALKEGLPVGIRTNVNLDNIDVIKQLENFYFEKGWTENKNFGYYFKATIPCFEDEEKKLSDNKLINTIGLNPDRVFLNSTFKNIYVNLYRLLVEKKMVRFKSDFCGAHGQNYTIDPYNHIFPCWDLVPNEKYSIGRVNIENGSFDFDEREKDWNIRTVDNIEFCKECKYKLFCGGGCAAQGLVANGDMYKPFCDDFEEKFVRTAKMILDNYMLD